MMRRSEEYFFPGEEIFSSPPFMFCVVDDMRKLYCNGCLKRYPREMRVCQKCKYVFYCGRECQQQHWDIHKLECRLLRKIVTQYPCDWERFVALLVLKLLDPKAWKIADQVCHVKTTFSDLHYKFFEDESYSEKFFTEIFVGLCHYIGEDMIAYEDFRPIYVKIWYNFSYIFERGKTRKAIGLYPGLSLFQHSCDADTLQVFDGFNLHLRMRRIVPSRNLSEISIDRLNLIVKRRMRRQNLKKMYFTDCSCSRCEDEEFENKITEVLDPERDPEIIYERFKKAASDIQIWRQKKDWKTVYDICKVSIKDMEEALGELNLYQLNTLQNASFSAFCLKKFQETADYLLKMITIYQFYYGPLHFSVIEVMLRLSMVEYFLKHKERSRILFYQSLRLKALTHGLSNPEYRKLARHGKELEDQNWANIGTELIVEFWRDF